jgi:hypothetical protein
MKTMKMHLFGFACYILVAFRAFAQAGGNESLVYQGLTNTGLGNATMALANANGQLIVSNLGSSGQDGVTITIPTNMLSLDVGFLALDPSNSLPVGAYLQSAVIGTAGSVTNGVLWTTTTTKVGTSNYSVSADFSPIGATTYSVQAYFQGALVGQGSNGPLCYVTSYATSTAFSGQQVRANSIDDWAWPPWAFATIASTTAVQCDHLYVTPDIASFTGTVTGFQITASQVPAIIFTNVSVTPLQISLGQTSSNLMMQWYGTAVLQGSTNLTTWTDITNAVSPYEVAAPENNIGVPQQFFRLSQ